MFKYVLYKLGQFLVNILPLKLSYRLASFLCECHYYISFRDRRNVQKNLRIISGDRENIPRLSKDVFHNFGLYLVEFFRLKRMVTDGFMEEHVTVEHLDRLQRATEGEKGAIVLTAHIGNWELGAVLMGKLGYPLTIIALPHKERTVNKFFNNQRMINGNKVVQTTQAIRACTQALKDNELVAIAADRDFSSSGELMNFFGRKARFPKGAAIFCLRENVPIIPTFLIREQEGHFRLTFEEPIYPSAAASIREEEEQIKHIMSEYIKVIEENIRQHPNQWLMFREFESA